MYSKKEIEKKIFISQFLLEVQNGIFSYLIEYVRRVGKRTDSKDQLLGQRIENYCLIILSTKRNQTFFHALITVLHLISLYIHKNHSAFKTILSFVLLLPMLTVLEQRRQKK